MLLKERYNYEVLNKVAQDIKVVYPPFNSNAFVTSIFQANWDELELKARVLKISEKLGLYLPSDFKEAVKIIDQVIPKYGDWLDGFSGFFPLYIDMYGQDEENWLIATKALARYTAFASSELAVRSFIIKDQDRMMKQLLEWTKDESEAIRRLASEGCRPQLPWAQALVNFKKDATPIIPILEALKKDSSEIVLRSVANNLNDISKTQPKLVIDLTSSWYGQSKSIDRLVKHALRTLLKKGDLEALKILGYQDASYLKIVKLKITRKIKMTSSTNFSFTITSSQTKKIRLEYIINYYKGNGKYSKKKYKIREDFIEVGENKEYTKKHRFIDTNSRKHIPGKHELIIVVNGQEIDKAVFYLK